MHISRQIGVGVSFASASVSNRMAGTGLGAIAMERIKKEAEL